MPSRRALARRRRARRSIPVRARASQSPRTHDRDDVVERGHEVHARQRRRSACPRSRRATCAGTAPAACRRRSARRSPAASRMPTMRMRHAVLLGQEPELAVAHDDEHAGALVHAVVVGRRHVEHALRADDVALLLERVAQRDAERFGAGLAGLECRRDRALRAGCRRPTCWRRTSRASLPNCFSYAAMYCCATFLVGFESGISSITSIGPAASTVPSTFSLPSLMKSSVATACVWYTRPL